MRRETEMGREMEREEETVKVRKITTCIANTVCLTSLTGFASWL